jgi:MATE family multidrug resistance protein
LADHPPAILDQEILYFRILLAGGPALLIGQAFSSFYSGRGRTGVVMIIDAAAAVLNLLLDYVWIFGYAGFPASGIAGAGWATVVALWVKVGIYLLLIWQKKNRRQFNTLSGMSLDRDLFRRVLYYGGPSGLQMLLDVAGFTTFILLVGRLGTVEAQATSMAFSISTLAFMPIYGFGLATSILVGQHLGEDRDDRAARATWTTLWVAVSYMALISTLFVVAPNVFLAGFFAAGSNVDQPVIHTMAANLLRFVAAYNLFDAMLMVFVSAIKGAGDTRFVLCVSLAMALVLSVLSWLSVEVFRLSVYGCWGLITVWVWILGLTYFARFMQGNWRAMRVIEQ